MAHPLSARLVLLAFAAALAASLVFAMIVAEQRDVDGRGAASAVPERVAAPAASASSEAPVERLGALRVTASGR